MYIGGQWHWALEIRHMLVHRTCRQLSIAMLPIIIQTNVGIDREEVPLLYVIVIIAIVLSPKAGLKLWLPVFSILIMIISTSSSSLLPWFSSFFYFQETGGLSNASAVCTRARDSSIGLFQPTRDSTLLMNMLASSGRWSLVLLVLLVLSVLVVLVMVVE